MAAQMTAQQVHKTVPASCISPCHSSPLLQCNTDPSLITFLFNESTWTLKPQRSDFRQGKVKVWLSLAGQLHTAEAKLNLVAVS